MGSAGGSHRYLQYLFGMCRMGLNIKVVPKSVFTEIAKFNSESSKKLGSCKVMNVIYRSFGGSNTQQ